MEYARLGSTGMKVSRICLGCMGFGDAARWIHKWVLDEENSRPIIQKALELGINFFDTANVYSIGASEEILGRALKDFARRDEVVIATKVFFEMSPSPNDRGLSRKHILSSIDASLKRLGTDYVDLYQIHRWDYDTPIEETLEALNDVVRAGKAIRLGARCLLTVFHPSTGQQAARQRRPGDDADALVAAQRQHLALFFPVDQVVMRLHRDKARPAVQVGGV